jgi:hypothetical protein
MSVAPGCPMSRDRCLSSLPAYSVPSQVTQDLDQLDQCEGMLCYLNANTWTSSNASAKLASEIAHAMSRGVQVVLAHEMPGVGGQVARFGIPFGSFFASDATPLELLKAGIYGTIAVALKGGVWREVSMVLMVQRLSEQPKRSSPRNIVVAQSQQDHQQDLLRTSKWSSMWKQHKDLSVFSCSSKLGHTSTSPADTYRQQNSAESEEGLEKEKAPSTRRSTKLAKCEARAMNVLSETGTGKIAPITESGEVEMPDSERLKSAINASSEMGPFSDTLAAAAIDTAIAKAAAPVISDGSRDEALHTNTGTGSASSKQSSWHQLCSCLSSRKGRSTFRCKHPRVC